MTINCLGVNRRVGFDPCRSSSSVELKNPTRSTSSTIRYWCVLCKGINSVTLHQENFGQLAAGHRSGKILCKRHCFQNGKSRRLKIKKKAFRILVVGLHQRKPSSWWRTYNGFGHSTTNQRHNLPAKSTLQIMKTYPFPSLPVKLDFNAKFPGISPCTVSGVCWMLRSKELWILMAAAFLRVTSWQVMMAWCPMLSCFTTMWFKWYLDIEWYRYMMIYGDGSRVETYQKIFGGINIHENQLSVPSGCRLAFAS